MGYAFVCAGGSSKVQREMGYAFVCAGGDPPALASTAVNALPRLLVYFSVLFSTLLTSLHRSASSTWSVRVLLDWRPSSVVQSCPQAISHSAEHHRQGPIDPNTGSQHPIPISFQPHPIPLPLHPHFLPNPILPHPHFLPNSIPTPK